MSIYWFTCSLLCTVIKASSTLPHLCQQELDEPKCEMKLFSEKVTCVGNIVHNTEFWKAKIVYLCSWEQNFLNPEKILNNFPFVQKLTIRKGNISEFLTDFPRFIYLEHLILIDLNISHLRPTLFVSLKNLKTLNLSKNNLRQISSDIIKNHSSLAKVILTGKFNF